jgi:DegV family protein with EDD domain
LSTAIVTDSNSGITQKQAEKLGIYVLPMPFEIDGTAYLEDITLTQEEFYRKLKDNGNISTSQPSIPAITKLWDKVLEQHEQIVHIPMSSGLSGSYNTSEMLAKDYNNKVFPVNNQRISVTQRQSVLDAFTLAAQGQTAEEIKEYLEEDRYQSSIYIMLDTLYYLKKGGRITPAAAALGTLLRLKPVLQIQGERLDAFAKARTAKQGKQIMIDAIKKDFETRFAEFAEKKTMRIQIAHTENEEAALELKEELMQIFPNVGDIYIDRLSLSVSCHIGPGALAIACSHAVV